MSKGKGQKIAIKFDKPLLGDVTGNELAFTISGMQRNPLGVGELELKTYTPSTVERYPVATLYEDDFTGTLDGVDVGVNGVVLGEDETPALSFDGVGDYVNCGDSFDITNSLKLEALIKTNTYTAYPRIVGSESKWILYISSNGKLAWFGSDIDTAFTNSPNLLDGEWHKVKAEYEGNGIHGYVDGVHVGTLPKTGNLTSLSGTPVTIGDRLSGDRSFDGVIAEVKIYKNDAVIAYWKLNEGTGTTAIDSAGINNGTINGATWVTRATGYSTPGTYTTTTPADILPTNPRLKWTEDLPAGTSITAEYAVNQDALTTPETWTAVNNSDLLTIPDPATGYFLWLKFTLATTDTAVTPTLLSVWLEEAEAPPDTILLSFDTYNRFNDVEGDITVEYNQGLGTLAGTRPVESFSVDFTPEDLEPTPIDEHTITAGIDLTVDLIDLEFTEIYADHNVTHTATAGVDVTVALINIEDINP